MVIFFDIDDTLVDSASAHIKVIGEFCREYSLVEGEVTEGLIARWFGLNEKYLKLYFSNRVSLEQQRVSRIKEFWESNGKSVTDRQALEIFEEYHIRFVRSCKVFGDVIPCLEKLSQFRLGVISNSFYKDQIYKLEVNQILPYFKDIIISENVGCAKPAKEIFELAAKQAGVSVSECIHIGDSFEADYQGSLNAGMKALLIDRGKAQNYSGINSINSLAELPGHPFLQP